MDRLRDISVRKGFIHQLLNDCHRKHEWLYLGLEQQEFLLWLYSAA